MIGFWALYIYLGIQVPIGAYNHPGCWAGDQWKPYYEKMLDSAVSCGLGYFSPGFMMFNITDTTTWITSEYPLEQSFHRYPPSLPVEDSVSW